MRCFDAGADLAFETGGVAGERALPPAEGGRAGVGHGDGAGDCALLVNGKVGDSLGTGVGVGLAGSVDEVGASFGLANATGQGVLPGEMLIGTVAGAGVEELFFAVDVDDGDVVVELREAEVGFEKETAITIGDGGEVGLHAGGACHGDEEFGELVVAATLARPDVVGVVDFLEALRLLFCAGVLAGEVGVFELHDGGVDLAELLVLACRTARRDRGRRR